MFSNDFAAVGYQDRPEALGQAACKAGESQKEAVRASKGFACQDWERWWYEASQKGKS